jgi:hypothetical protein
VAFSKSVSNEIARQLVALNRAGGQNRYLIERALDEARSEQFIPKP